MENILHLSIFLHPPFLSNKMGKKCLFSLPSFHHSHCHPNKHCFSFWFLNHSQISKLAFIFSVFVPFFNFCHELSKTYKLNGNNFSYLEMSYPSHGPPDKVEYVIDIDVSTPPPQMLMLLQRKCRGDDKIYRDILFGQNGQMPFLHKIYNVLPFFLN